MNTQELRERGWFLLPLEKGTKDKPLVRGFGSDHVGSWQYPVDPEDNVGILLVPSDIIVLDVDDVEIWAQVKTDKVLPSTYTVQTPRVGGGYHYYFKHTDRTRVAFGGSKIKGRTLGFDVKTTGYVAAAGCYRLDVDAFYKAIDNSELAEFPDWVVDLYQKMYSTTADGAEGSSLRSPLAWKSLSWLAFDGLRVDTKIERYQSRHRWAWAMGVDIGRYGFDECSEIFERMHDAAIEYNAAPDFTFEGMMFQFNRGLKEGLNQQWEVIEEEANPFSAVVVSDFVDPDLAHYTQGRIRMITPMDQVRSMAQMIKPGANYSIQALTDAFAGYTLGASTIIFAPSGTGKTTFIQKEVLNLLKQGYKVSLISTEETPDTTFKNLYRAGSGEVFADLETDDEEANVAMYQRKLEAYSKFFEGMQLYVPAEVTKLRLDDVVDYVNQCAAEGIHHIFLDNITALASKSKANSQEQTWTVIERVTSTVTDLARTANISLTVVGHTSVEKSRVDQYSIKGGQSLANMFDNIVYLAQAEMPAIRDAQDNVVMDYRVLEILKVRVNAAFRGRRIGVKYDPSNHQIIECPEVMDAELKDRMNPRSEVRGVFYKEPTDRELKAMGEDEFTAWLEGIKATFKLDTTKLMSLRTRYNSIPKAKKAARGGKEDF